MLRIGPHAQFVTIGSGNKSPELLELQSQRGCAPPQLLDRWQADAGAGDLWGALPWWKWWALDHWLTEHPEVRRLAWIDDDLDGRRAGPSTGTSPSKRAWTIETALRSGAGVDALLLAPARHEGLRPLDVRIVADWIFGIR